LIEIHKHMITVYYRLGTLNLYPSYSVENKKSVMLRLMFSKY
jgi:hypothetical protein